MNSDGASPLILSITSKNVAAITYLLKKGALLNEKQAEGQTALHIAAIMDDENIVLLLRQYGADVNIVDNDGKKPVDLCRPDNATLIKSFTLPVKLISSSSSTTMTKTTNENDDDDDESSSLQSAADEKDDDEEMNFDNIITLCATLRTTFEAVENPDALRRMIKFYDEESAKLKSRLATIESTKTKTNQKESDNDDDDNESKSDVGNSAVELVVIETKVTTKVTKQDDDDDDDESDSNESNNNNSNDSTTVKTPLLK